MGAVQTAPSFTMQNANGVPTTVYRTAPGQNYVATNMTPARSFVNQIQTNPNQYTHPLTGHQMPYANQLPLR